MDVVQASRFHPPLRGQLPDHLVRQDQEGWGHRDPEDLGGLEVDDELEFRGLLYGQVGGLGPLQNLIDVCGPSNTVAAI